MNDDKTYGFTVPYIGPNTKRHVEINIVPDGLYFAQEHDPILRAGFYDGVTIPNKEIPKLLEMIAKHKRLVIKHEPEKFTLEEI